ncbi:hypothetical protein D3C80_1239190 [compost metagenome]
MAEEGNLLVTSWASGEAFEYLVQGQRFSGVFGHHNGHIRRTWFAHHAEGIITGSEFAIPMSFYFQTSLGFFFNSREKYLLNKPRAHPAQRFMIGIDQSLGCRYCRG